MARGQVAVAGGSTGTGVGGQRLRMQRGAVVRKAAEDNSSDRRRRNQRIQGCGDRYRRRAVGGKAIDPGGNRGKGDRNKLMDLAEFDGAAIARGQRVILTPAAAVPDRTDGMNDMPRGQPVAQGDFGVAGLAAAELAAFGQQFGAGRPMDCAIDATPAEQRGVRRVDDRVNAQGRDVSDDDFDADGAELARGQAQADAAALTVTPLSASSCCNSPAWNISRIISQPPTNSPLT
jgi:hypothetical protein